MCKKRDKDCKGACAYTGDPGDPYGKPSDRTVICPDAIPICDGDSLCETLLHEMVHACGEPGFPGPGKPGDYDPGDGDYAPVEQYCEDVGHEGYPHGQPCGKGRGISPK